jgi:hypothetical protein
MAKVKWVYGNVDWTTGAAWNTGTVPSSSDTAILGGNTTYTVSVTTAVTVGGISITDLFATLSVSVPGGTPG